MRYQIIGASTVLELQTEVNNFLLKNSIYSLLGGPFANNGGYYQAVEKLDFTFNKTQLND